MGLITLYLNKKRSAILGDDPRKAIYELIDGHHRVEAAKQTHRNVNAAVWICKCGQKNLSGNICARCRQARVDDELTF